ALLPHTGDMCLLDLVERWSDDEIVCRVDSHRDARHPLRCGDQLPAVAGVEFAAQAIGVHGCLVTRNHAKPAAGYLVSLRDLQMHTDRLDTLNTPLTIRARRLADNGDTVMCEFDVSADQR